MKNIAVIGAGYWGQNLVRNYHQLGVLKSVCDASDITRKKIKELYPTAQVTKDAAEVFDDPEIEGVVIALPAEQHFAVASAALLKNKDVFVEKPLALHLSEARELNRIAREKNRILMVGHLLQYHSAFLKLKELVLSGALGRLEYIYSNRLSLGKIRREENILWSFAPHDISMILGLCNEVPDKVSAVGHNYLHKELADVTTTHLSFPSGINAHIFVSWLHPFKEQKLVVVASKKMAVFEDTQPWDKKLTLYEHQINWKNNVPIPEKGEPQYIAVEPSEPLQAECKHFIDCIASRGKPRTDGEEGYHVLEILDKAQKSLEAVSRSPNTLQESTPRIEKNYFVHESAYVDEPCQIGENTKIWHFSHVQKNCVIGKKCIIGQNVNIANDAIIGNNVKIQNNVSVYTGVCLEDDVFLGPSCVLTNVSNPRSQVDRHSLYEKTVIKRGATIGANATIVCGVTIGRYAFVGAGSVVTKNVADYAMIVGNPGKQIGWMSRHGVKLPKPDAEGIMRCPESGLRYRLTENGLLQCIDLEEETPLPEHMRSGKQFYKELTKHIQN
ncbi:MAG: Gfo/Idh/MocA family oxidoreductase [Chitinivibrionales bacterium]|nr:Gfo/Idh/MocA family oxidoreductase [Chitinivibrionales bacterium]